MFERECRTCGEWFETDKEWAYECLPCWKRRKDAERAQEREAERASRNEYQRGWDAGYQRGLEVGAALHRSSKEIEQPDDRFWLQVLQLCHPDHQPSDRAELATRVTARINQWRRQPAGKGRSQ